MCKLFIIIEFVFKIYEKNQAYQKYTICDILSYL